MKHHSDKSVQRVFAEVLLACGNALTRFEAADCAVRLLARHKGNLEKALEDARKPFHIGNHLTY